MRSVQVLDLKGERRQVTGIKKERKEEKGEKEKYIGR